METINLIEIRKELPFGAIQEIAKRAGVHAPTLSRFLKGDKRSPKIPEMTTQIAIYLKEYRAKQKEAKELLNEALLTN